MNDQTIEVEEAAACRDEAAAMPQQAQRTMAEKLRELLLRNAELFEQLARLAERRKPIT
ncbi:MAG: hypothetical protein JO310_15980 [Hyphomicrobiales bacterium]|nr:hypothetical protein [Hyphomicrobiales bacterium]